MSKVDRTELVLPPSMTIAEINTLVQEWAGVADSASDLSINASEVQRTDGAALQLLLTVVKAIREKDGLVTWSDTSDSLNNVARILGMTTALGIK